MDSKHVSSLTPGELHRWMEEKKAMVLIHTLGADHYQRVHLPTSKNACVFEVTFIDQIKAITDDKAAEIVLYGSSDRSMDAQVASQKLYQEGYRRIHVLAGGLDGWRAAGYPLEGEAASTPDDPQTMLSIEEGTYPVDTGLSTIQWTGRNPNTTHFGNIEIAEGQLDVVGGKISGTVTIDMNSITNINLDGDELQPVLIDHLKSDDFFLTRLFPSATFRIMDGAPAREPYLTSPNYRFKGLLELRGVNAELEFAATITASADQGLVAEAHFDIDRTQWNIIYGSTRFFEHLGMHVVFDLISVQVRIVTA